MLKDKISLEHGAGGRTMAELIKSYMLKYFKSTPPEIEVPLTDLDDSSIISGIVFTTDSYTVKPIFFPGGNIGSLSVAGTVNDISVMGADPIALSSGMVIPEGFPFEDLEKILKSMASTADIAGVPIITGDTKVVERTALDQIIINTSGIGKAGKNLDHNMDVVRNYRPNFNEKWLKDSNIRSGDRIIISGTVGDHGITILSSREGYGFEGDIQSDIYPLNKMIELALNVGGIVAMKDPTRGGLSNTLNEWSEKAKVGILIEEQKIPIKDYVKNACEVLGIDPLEIGNEGKVVIAVVKEMAEDVLFALKKTNEGKDAAIIGVAMDNIDGVVMRTTVGGKRIVQQPAGDPVPRIC